MPSTAPGPVGGTVYFTIKGRQYDLSGDLTVQPGGKKREAVPGLSGKGCGWTETIEDGAVEATFATLGSLNVTDLRAIAGVSAQVECINGHRYITDTLYCQECDPIDPVKGTVKVKFGCIGPMREA